MRRLSLFLALAGLSAALGGACATTLAQRFPHSVHLTGYECGQAGQPQCLSCPSCHQGATDNKQNWARPDESLCVECHQDEKSKQTIAARPAGEPVPAAYAIVFNHDKHLEMKDINGQCVGCHAGAVSSAPGRLIFPPMDTCLNCHEHEAQFLGNQCGPCHTSNDVRALKPVTFLPHDQAWNKRHGQFARTDIQACVVCHAQAQCDACHDATQTIRPELRNPEAIEREYVHRFDYISRHAIEARSQPGQCFSCHTTNDCDACHTQRGVSGSLSAGRNPHGPNWAVGVGPDTNRHGAEARHDIVQCAACHDQGPATNCVRCHKVGGFGGNPHPRGWNSANGVDSRACTACHSTGGL